MGISLYADEASEVIPCPPCPASPCCGGLAAQDSPLGRASLACNRVEQLSVLPLTGRGTAFSRQRFPIFIETSTDPDNYTRCHWRSCRRDGNKGPCQHVKLISWKHQEEGHRLDPRLLIMSGLIWTVQEISLSRLQQTATGCYFPLNQQSSHMQMWVFFLFVFP